MSAPGNTGKGFAWRLEDGSLCNWALPTREQMLAEGIKPSTDAKLVRVRIVESSEYKRMLESTE